jgi:hypothetical protein
MIERPLPAYDDMISTMLRFQRSVVGAVSLIVTTLPAPPMVAHA